MIKNEEKIIERCLTNTLPLIDAICITDTGSTDNTIKIITEIFERLQIPVKLYHDEWKNFGYNRTNSFLNTLDFCKELNWDLDKTYGLLLDADMNLVINDFNKNELIMDGYNIIQSDINLDYYNTRFLKMNFNWKCIGVTHEYWKCENIGIITKDKIYINDIGDGGCKSDKISRDIKLLENGIINEPTNKRYYFYLAQSYKDNQEFNKAIDFYKKRIKLDGWYEEVWYSYYMISECYLLLKNEEKFEYWALKSYKLYQYRAEPIYKLVKYFRESCQYYKAYHYYLIGKNILYPKDNILFIEKNIYKCMFDYEYTILQYYVFPKERLDGLKNLINYYNIYSFNLDLTFNNMTHYMNLFIGDGVVPLNILYSYLEFKPSSISLLKLKDKILANIKFVNYTIDKIITKNAFIYLNYNCEIISELTFMNDKIDLPNKDTIILELENIKLFNNNDKNYYIALTLNNSYNDNIRIIKGEYNTETNEFKNNICVIPPIETESEKNWVMIENNIIYKWYPLEIGILINNKLEIIYTHDTPKFFNNYKGSTNAFEYNNEFWFITHGIINCTPIKYFHQIVVLDKTYKVIKYTVPFYFDKLSIEYCLGFIIINEIIYMSSSSIITIKLKNIQKYFLFN